MKTTIRKLAMAPLLAVLSLAVTTGKAWAVITPSANLDLHVNFAGQLSVKVDDVYASTRAVSGGPATAQVPASSATVTNDATGLTEQWQLSLAASTGNWTVTSATSASPGLDKFDYQAMFISSDTASSCPAAGHPRWEGPVSTVTAVAEYYRSFRYSDPTVVNGSTGKPDVNTGTQNGNMYVVNGAFPGSGKRGLCVRVRLPSSISTQSSQLIRLTITAASAL